MFDCGMLPYTFYFMYVHMYTPSTFLSIQLGAIPVHVIFLVEDLCGEEGNAQKNATVVRAQREIFAFIP